MTYSESDGVPFLYVSKANECITGHQGEWLLNVTNPTAPVDITPPGTQVLNGQAASYWSWYYRANGVHGFNHLAPRVGKFSGRYFYRAAKSVLDVHRWSPGLAPVADFSFGPGQIFPGTPVSFTDLSTGSPTSWSWEFNPDGTPLVSTARNPVGITFPSSLSPAKSVRLEVCNAAGCDTELKPLTVLPVQPPPPPGMIFRDGFEEGNLRLWSAAEGR